VKKTFPRCRYSFGTHRRAARIYLGPGRPFPTALSVVAHPCRHYSRLRRLSLVRAAVACECFVSSATLYDGEREQCREGRESQSANRNHMIISWTIIFKFSTVTLVIIARHTETDGGWRSMEEKVRLRPRAGGGGREGGRED